MYRYTTFDGIWLPDVLPEDDLNAGAASGSILGSLGGSFDYLGSTRSRPKRQAIQYRGTYLGGMDYLVDESGNYIVDESGNRIINTTANAVDLRDKLDTLKAKIGRRGLLIRQAEADGSQQYKLARLLSANHLRVVKDADRIALLDLAFEADGRPWRSVAQSAATAVLAADATTTVAVSPGGTEDIRDAVITITANGGTVTGLEMTLGSDTDFSFGTIADGSVLVIDTGAMTVLRDGSDAYDIFTLEAGHVVEGWLTLAPGTNSLAFILTGGPADLSITYYEQWS
jgi:hypothetical protein